MSDAMTNREIEDVLTSIRRLVAQEGTRSVDTGRLILTEAQRIVSEAGPPETENNDARDAGRGAVPDQEPSAGPVLSQGDDPTRYESEDNADLAAGAEAEQATEFTVSDQAGTGVGVGVGQGGDEPADADDEARDDYGLPAPDFGQLEATIAELEAAVSASSRGEALTDAEARTDAPEGPVSSADPVPETSTLDEEEWAAAQTEVSQSVETSNVTALYGRLSFQHRRQTADPEQGTDPAVATDAAPDVAEDAGSGAMADAVVAGAATGSATGSVTGSVTGSGTPSADAPEGAETHGSRPDVDVAEKVEIDLQERYALPDDARQTTGPEVSGDDPGSGAGRDETFGAPGPGDETGAMATPEGLDDTRDDMPEDTVIDEAMLRVLVAQIVREELHGQLGERITKQVRKLVRAEIAKALDDRNYL